jgi:hypothetical protein
MHADRFNRLLGRQEYPSDFWVVEFRKILPPGVAAESPGSILIEVVDANSMLREVLGPGRCSDWQFSEIRS